MKGIINRYLIVLIVLSGSAKTYAQTASADLNIIPVPAEVSCFSGTFPLNDNEGIILGPGVSETSVRVFNDVVKQLTGFDIPVKKSGKKGRIFLTIDSLAVMQKEGYILTVTSEGVNVTGHDSSGIFYALQSIIQLIKHDNSHGYYLPVCTIKDYPRFSYRGMHLDVSRHYFSTGAIKKWINILALYKINNFHWHLTDDQGWRVEIKRYPELQRVAAFRDETLIGHKKDLPHRFDGQRYGGYYTQQEVKDIVKYAADRNITVIPEIEMPGHALAALAAYPVLGCTGGAYRTATFWGIFNDVYCAGKEQSFQFLQNVLDEVISLFPSRYIHIGGDECLKDKWKSCPHCQKRIKDEHLKDEQELQSYFIGRIEKYLNARNRQIIGWDEILEGGLAPGATVMSWTGEEGGIEAAKLGHDVIMTPEKFVYLDYYQSLYPEEPLAAGGYLPLKKLYQYDPVPSQLNALQAQHIKGVQANVWTEYMKDPDHAEYMMFPRMLALAETAWSPKHHRDFKHFLSRVRSHGDLLKRLNVHYAGNFDEVTDSVSRTANGSILLHLKSERPDAVIKYTRTDKIPGLSDSTYNIPVLLASSGSIKANVFINGKAAQRTYTKRFNINKATGKSISFTTGGQGNFNPAPQTSVDGINGSSLYNDQQWFGFSGGDLEVVIDLGSVNEISNIQTHILNYRWQRMWPPGRMLFSVSADGKNYRQVYSEDRFPKNGINLVSCSFSPLRARYVKIFARNQGIIPPGEYGAGGKAWLLVDEFIVN